MIKTLLADILVTIVMAALIFAGVHFTLEQCIVHQVSMLPSLKEGQRIFINKITYHLHTPDRGDIIVFKLTDSADDIPLIKRVIGLPGETIEIKSGLVYVCGSALEEPYVNECPNYVLKPFVVPESQYFVLGDNRNMSNDSHYGWTVPVENIMGKAWISIWPPDNWGLVPACTYAQ